MGNRKTRTPASAGRDTALTIGGAHFRSRPREAVLRVKPASMCKESPSLGDGAHYLGRPRPAPLRACATDVDAVAGSVEVSRADNPGHIDLADDKSAADEFAFRQAVSLARAAAPGTATDKAPSVAAETADQVAGRVVVTSDDLPDDASQARRVGF